MLDKLKSFFVFPKKEAVHDVGLAFIEPVLLSITNDVLAINAAFNDVRHLVDSGFRIGFDKIPSAQLHDLIEKTQEFSAMLEAADVQNKVKLTELLAGVYDNAVRCSAAAAFLVNSTDPDSGLKKVLVFFDNVKNWLEEVGRLL